MNPIILLGAAALLFFKKGKKTLEELEFEPTSVIWSKTLKQFVLYMDVINPNSQEVKVDNVFLSIFDNDKKIGSIEKTNSFTIKKANRTKISLPIKMSAIGIITDLLLILADKNKKKTHIFKVAGTAKVFKLDVPISEEVEFSL